MDNLGASGRKGRRKKNLPLYPYRFCQVVAWVGGKLLPGSSLGPRSIENKVKKSAGDSAGQRG